MFGREIRNNLPSFCEFVDDYDVRDIDAEKKGLSKIYTDKARSAKESCITVGDRVLVKRDKPLKLNSRFTNQPFEVVDKAGSKVTVRFPDGVLYDRHLSNVKLYQSPEIQLIEPETPKVSNPEPQIDNSHLPDYFIQKYSATTCAEPSLMTELQVNPIDPQTTQRCTQSKHTPLATSKPVTRSQGLDCKITRSGRTVKPPKLYGFNSES